MTCDWKVLWLLALTVAQLWTWFDLNSAISKVWCDLNEWKDSQGLYEET